jgi:hypothetical protein
LALADVSTLVFPLTSWNSIIFIVGIY